ncbi:hypothetical protein HCA62_08830 [Listeria booriae]|nr:hypothetical protein [Listeria booriae]
MYFIIRIDEYSILSTGINAMNQVTRELISANNASVAIDNQGVVIMEETGTAISEPQ